MNDKIKKALEVGVVVLFMKGDRKCPEDGYQKEAIEILNRSQVRYITFNVVTNSELREILKQYANFSSYPMLFVDSKFVGGLMFMRETEKHGGLAQIIPSTEV